MAAWVQPSCLHSGQQGGGRNKKWHVFLLRTFPGSCTYPSVYELELSHMAIPGKLVKESLLKWPCVQLQMWDPITEEEGRRDIGGWIVVSTILPSNLPICQPTHQPTPHPPTNQPIKHSANIYVRNGSIYKGDKCKLLTIIQCALEYKRGFIPKAVWEQMEVISSNHNN